MSKHKSKKMILVSLVLFVSVVYFGCEKKTDNTEEKTNDSEIEEITPDTTSVDPTEELKDPVEETEIVIPDLKGTWIGTFDKRSTNLKITEQTDSSFSGKISISYREAINQEVKGTISPTTMKMSMKDQLHSRYQGIYNGKLSEDGNNFSGTFTMDLDGSKFSFNLNKK